ncbi:hypothetical protein [Legionella jamestowniensis]|uniref:Phasin protein n=1 Tax=Legionella jamestowniensis TaxID=455 RepID=A0A0W0UJR8_9GAMM|nr:hypothetical protein [Legionella jamestowniensis]KTD07769.1 hypothetical protein Ljam_1964 [Legionella jamestowniensis]SFL61907.1 hypothetical protein SAMN02746073_1088 [Legionella jamestowniensis DSM 19215]
MQQDYVSNWTNMMSRMQRPLQAMMELNTRTLQNISYLKPEDFSKIRKPEELLEKQMNVFVENAHKALDYMQKSFSIFEESLLSVSREVKDRTEQTTRQAQDVMKKTMKQAQEKKQ